MALLFTLLLAAAACILGYFLLDFGRKDFLRETEAAIDIEINMLSNLESQQHDELIHYIQRREAHDKNVRFRYESENGQSLAGAIDPLPHHLGKLTEGVLSFDLQDGKDNETFAAKIHTFSDGSRLVVARNIDSLIESHNRLRHFSFLIMFLMSGVIIVSFGISYFVVSRINRIAAIAQNIAQTGDLSQRIATDSHWDDLSSLSLVLNGFLARIENLMESAREVSNNIAHDLRTPLSSLRGEIEALKGRQLSDKDIDALLTDTDRILSIFQAILRIANLEQARRDQIKSVIRLSDILTDVIELYEPLAQEKNINFETHLDGPAIIWGDADLIFQMLANLFDNAIKFSGMNETIQVQMFQSGNQIHLSIQDSGAGIPDDEKDKVFRHFYRSDTSRHIPGNGLGLSLVKAITEYHGAQIHLSNAAPGLRVEIIFSSYQ